MQVRILWMVVESESVGPQAKCTRNWPSPLSRGLDITLRMCSSVEPVYYVYRRPWASGFGALTAVVRVRETGPIWSLSRLVLGLNIQG